MSVYNEIGETIRKHSIHEKSVMNSAESFRLPMTITEIHLFQNRTAYPVCPRCRITLDREYQAYCDRCGQALNWKSYRSAVIVRIT